MQLAEFVEQRIHGGRPHPSVARLAQLAGQVIGNTRFDATLDQARARLEPWMPLYFLPFGEAGGFHVGLHLRPSDLASGRFAVVQMQDPGAIMEVSGSLEHLIYFSLAYEEGSGGGRPRPRFYESLALAQKVFGESFYQQGRHGKFSDDDAQAIAAGVHGGSADYYFTSDVLGLEPEAQRPWVTQGMEAEPGCMAFPLRAAHAHVERGERAAAAAMIARALTCFHHTSYEDSLDGDYALGRQLLDELPGAFSEVDRRDLETQGDKPRLMWVMELYQAGRVEEATKILCDMCHEMRDYDSVLHLFRKHFEKLSWDWAIALCDFRSGS